MKKLIQIIILNVFALGAVQAQQFTAETYYEHVPLTVPILGMASGYTFENYMNVGLFYQSSSRLGNASAEIPQIREEEYIGGYFSARVREWPNLSFDVKIRAGLMDQSNFVISPGFQLDYHPISRIHFGLGVAARVITPSVISYIKIDLGRVKSE